MDNGLRYMIEVRTCLTKWCKYKNWKGIYIFKVVKKKLIDYMDDEFETNFFGEIAKKVNNIREELRAKEDSDLYWY